LQTEKKKIVAILYKYQDLIVCVYVFLFLQCIYITSYFTYFFFGKKIQGKFSITIF